MANVLTDKEAEDIHYHIQIVGINTISYIIKLSYICADTQPLKPSCLPFMLLTSSIPFSLNSRFPATAGTIGNASPGWTAGSELGGNKLNIATRRTSPKVDCPEGVTSAYDR